MSRQNNRVEYIDLFRAFGIILMIMGHIKFGSYFDKWIHAFHMPMFFFISGWFYRSDDVVPLGIRISKKAKSLLVPYFVFEMTQWAILLPFIPEYRSMRTLIYIFAENTYKIPVESGTFGISPVPGAMWFLTAIFFVEVIYNLLDRRLHNNWKLNTTVAVLVALGMIAPAILPLRLPWALDAAFVGIGFFHLARIIRRTRAEKLLNLKLWQAAVMEILVSVLIMGCPIINMRTGSYGWYLPFWVNALGAIIAGWNLFRYVDIFLKKVLVSMACWLKDIGKNSIVYLCFNQIVILSVRELLNIMDINYFLLKILTLVVTLAVLFAFEKLICNTKLKVIIGK